MMKEIYYLDTNICIYHFRHPSGAAADKINFYGNSYIDERVVQVEEYVQTIIDSCIKYNKHIQKLLGININNYKQLSGKYKIGGINSYGKEYMLNTNVLLFEGEYKNRKRNGQGKEYNILEELIYEGGYINGKRDGYGLEYNNKGELIFEGEYKNGKRWKGYGKVKIQ